MRLIPTGRSLVCEPIAGLAEVSSLLEIPERFRTERPTAGRLLEIGPDVDPEEFAPGELLVWRVGTGHEYLAENRRLFLLTPEEILAKLYDPAPLSHTPLREPLDSALEPDPDAP